MPPELAVRYGKQTRGTLRTIYGQVPHGIRTLSALVHL